MNELAANAKQDRQWRYGADPADYGGPKVDEETSPRSRPLSADRKTVTSPPWPEGRPRGPRLLAPSLQLGRRRSAGSTEARYTLKLPGGASGTGEEGRQRQVPRRRQPQTADGTEVQVWTCDGTGAQQWTPPGDGTVRALGKC